MIIKAIQRSLDNNLKGAVKDGDGPIWSGGLLWADVKTMLSKEAVSLEGLTESEARAKCLQILHEIADKEGMSIT